MAHAHDHDHAHEGQAHTHSHDLGHDAPDGEYYLGQLLTVLVTGSLGVIGILLCVGGEPGKLFSPSFYVDLLSGGPAGGTVGFLLVSEFHRWVLLGSAALLALTALRMAALWVQVGKQQAAAGHVHGPDCDHGPDDHAGHSHGSGTTYLKVIPFALPILLYVMGLPNASFSKEWVAQRLGKVDNIGDVAAVQDKGGDAVGFDFNELNAAAYDPAKRAQFEGRRIRVKGQVKKVSEKDYQLFRLKMTCCAADVIPLKARIRSDIVIPETRFPDQSWATVEGVLQFVELPEKKQFLPVIRVGGQTGPLGLTPASAE